tara:strand:- start:602 stop:1723 length:1122 start_codon:yes stop_codon:yes gene_type:complete
MSKKRTILTTPEPEWYHTEGLTPEEISKKLDGARQWYWSNHRFDARKHKTWVMDYLKKTKADEETVKNVKANTVNSFKNQGVLCRMFCLDAPLDETQLARLNETVAKLARSGAEKRAKAADKPTKPKVSIQDRIKAQVDDYVAELEATIDKALDEIQSKGKTTVSIEDWLKRKEVKAQQAGMIAEYFSGRAEEVRMAYEKEDEQLVEGYDFLTKPQLRKYLAFMQDVCNKPSEYASVVKTIRRPRKKKKKTAGQITQKVQFLPESKEYGLKSCEPREIVGANKLVVFNEKTRVFAIYYASSMAEELSVKGTTLIGFDKEKSTQRKLRKPKEMLKDIKNIGIRAISNKYKGLTTTESVPTGRLNKHTVLIKAFK